MMIGKSWVMIGVRGRSVVVRLVPDELWALAEPFAPKFRPRPQRGGTAPLYDRAVFIAIVYVLARGIHGGICHRRLGVPFQTAHRRFRQWTRGLRRRLH
jgi:transposase